MRDFFNDPTPVYLINFAIMFHIDPTIQNMLGNAIHHVKDLSITLLNVQGLFVFWNKGASQLDGYEPSEIIGKPLNTLHPAIEKQGNLSEYLLRTAAKEGRAKHIGKRIKKDGSTYWASVIVNAVFDEAGKHVGYIRIARELRGNEVD